MKSYFLPDKFSMLKNLGFVILLLPLLYGCVSTERMDAEFYADIEQPSEDYIEAFSDLGILIRFYEGNQKNLYIKDWQVSILKVSKDLYANSKKLYSITNYYCPTREEIYCKDIETLYMKTQELSGSLVIAAKGSSSSQMLVVVGKYEDVLAHLEKMSN